MAGSMYKRRRPGVGEDEGSGEIRRIVDARSKASTPSYAVGNVGMVRLRRQPTNRTQDDGNPARTRRQVPFHRQFTLICMGIVGIRGVARKGAFVKGAL